MLSSAQIKCGLESDETGKGSVPAHRSEYLQYRDFSVLVRPSSIIAVNRIEIAQPVDNIQAHLG